ncbi:glycosyl transferase family 1 [candidate division GN15 bacterium]|uniref:Glycosyl transferase family 1 n=1 Tax=candidate division GN15 bacterium TaxID=2072418 RepID=A0A855X4G4_9BACT|nr:MAG: glycosyl transferase family 1 [candidate division GN15 bacterium]
MNHILSEYESIVGSTSIRQLRHLGDRLSGIRLVHVNSTREGGGVAEILGWMVPLMQDLGLEASWEVITGTPDFYRVTKSIHNGLQGTPVQLSSRDWALVRDVNAAWAEQHRDTLKEADVVIIHDPQPSMLIDFSRNGRSKWIWRAHIDISHPYRAVWKNLQNIVEKYDASIFSLNAFAQHLPHPQYLIPPSIDPLSEKNCEQPRSEIRKLCRQFDLDCSRPILLQVSRFDRFKDPVGVIKAYRIVRKVAPVQLILAGGGASDDPEGNAVYQEVLEASQGDDDIHVLLLPPDAHRTINGLQRLADIVIQKSTKEGFGLTVTEAMWKGKPVIGGDTGGIRLQVVDYRTGFLVSSPEGAAHRIRFLLDHRRRLNRMGDIAQEFVRENFLLTRHLREYLTLVCALTRTGTDRILYI